MILLALLFALPVHASAVHDTDEPTGVQVACETVEINLHRYAQVLNDPSFPLFTDIQPKAVLIRPSPSLAHLTNPVLQNAVLTEELKALMVGSIEHPVSPFRDTLIVVKGPNVHLGMITPDKFLFACTPDHLQQAVWISLHVMGAWSHLNRIKGEWGRVKRMML